ncbi:MAG: hypothetical protein FD189_1557 [Elusimicrobia bacterium]|nr:MAG: hypothetical protein FD154_1792 [Elusimicrobiota bacterium]KAF0155046.1 MAG: hypothetical protein FD189_1557 [Elusimicrobiota bacterium]
MLKKILIALGAGLVLLLAAAFYMVNHKVRHEAFSTEYISAPIPEGFLPISENRPYFRALMTRAKAPEEAIETILDSSPGTYLNPHTMVMLNFSAVPSKVPCGQLYPAMSAAAPEKVSTRVDIGGRSWLRNEHKRDNTLEYFNCSDDVARTLVYADPARTTPDLPAFSSAHLATVTFP